MVTRIHLDWLFALVLVSCGGSTAATSNPTNIPPGGQQYDGKGFVVHEWGTDTIVVGTDGSLQRGLHHEEEDLPPFVMDRMKATKLGAPVEVKMETPVTYFYAPAPMTAQVSVQFPQGILTQWYPEAQSFYPLLAETQDGSHTIKDPVLDPTFVFGTSQCSVHYGQAQNGLLDWGQVDIGGRGDAPTLEDASLDTYSWSYAREVASNPVRVTTSKGLQSEKFLFYRGVGNNTLPVNITASDGPSGYDGGVTLSYPKTTVTDRVPAAFVLRVGATSGAFVAHPEGIAPAASLTDVAPPLDAAALPLDAFSEALARAMVVELDKTGLFHDESTAMVHTWQRQWFKTPGVRVLYLMPQAFTDAQIPLTITPAPDKLTRVMVIRVEVLTHAIEDEDTKFLAAIQSGNSSDPSAAHFIGLGRFAEPRLRRAMALLPTSSTNQGAQALLQSIAGANVALSAGE